MLSQDFIQNQTRFQLQPNKEEDEEETADNDSVLLIRYHCFNTNAIGWQLGCLIVTYFLFYMIKNSNLLLLKYQNLCDNHCKCFYIKSIDYPPTYDEVCEQGLPVYSTTIVSPLTTYHKHK